MFLKNVIVSSSKTLNIKCTFTVSLHTVSSDRMRPSLFVPVQLIFHKSENTKEKVQ